MGETDLEIDIDDMSFDLFQQAPIKKKIENLNDLKQYRGDDYIGDDDFDIAYRTPLNIKVKDLLSTNYKEIYRGDKEYNELFGPTLGFIDKEDNSIKVLNRKEMEERTRQDLNHPEYSNKFSKNEKEDIIKNIFPSVLMHESAHQKYNTRREKMLHSYSKPIESEWIFGPKSIDEFTKEFEDYAKKHEKIEGGETYKTHYKNNRDEMIANAAEINPKDIINPINKITKNLNRLWFD